MQAFEYFAKQSNFGSVEKYATYLAGPVVMYFVGKHVKNKYVYLFFPPFCGFPSICYVVKWVIIFAQVRHSKITQR